MSKKLIFIIIGALLLLVLGYFLFVRAYTKTSSEPLAKVYSGEVVVKITQKGFIPDEFTITKGTKVRFINEDSIGHWPASDIHPSHTLYPEFDIKGVLKPGEEWSFTFEKVGEWGIHDHLAPYIVGKITVVEGNQ